MLFVYLSYEDASNNYVYFDDFKVTTTKTNIVQYNEYYPFGLQTANSWTRDNTTGNNFLGNGGTEYNATSSLYDLDFRNYDPVLGRLHGVDPVADKYSSLTPYNFAFNNPAGHNDPSGADPFVANSRFEYEELSLQRQVAMRNYGSGQSVAGGSGTDFSGCGTDDTWAPNPDMVAYMGGGGGRGMGISFGGPTVESINQMEKDAQELSPEEYGAKYGTAPTTQEVSKTFAAAGLQVTNTTVQSGLAFIIYVEPALVNSKGETLQLQTNNVVTFEASGAAVGTSLTAIIFNNAGEGYKYMWEQSFDSQGGVLRELSAFNTSKGVVVLPTEGVSAKYGKFVRNGPRRSYNDRIPVYRNKQTGLVTIPFLLDERAEVHSQIHTHPNEQDSDDLGPDRAYQKALGRPVYLIRTDGFYNLGGKLGPSSQYFNSPDQIRK